MALERQALSGINVKPHAPPSQKSSSDLPTCPSWLSEHGKAIWEDLVDGMIAAGIQVRAIDSHLISMTAYRLSAAYGWADKENDESISLAARLGISKLVEKHMSAAEAGLDKLCATPKSRIQAGIKGQAKNEPGALARILAAKHGIK